jgi:hypothetical protein
MGKFGGGGGGHHIGYLQWKFILPVGVSLFAFPNGFQDNLINTRPLHPTLFPMINSHFSGDKFLPVLMQRR